MGMTPDRLITVGIDFHTAPVHVRERWAISDSALARLQAEVRGPLAELVVIRTCNRTELTAWVADPTTGAETLLELWAEAVGSPRATPGVPVSVLRGMEAGRHLLRVTAGLESQILGDIHILGQVRRCYREAREAGTVSANLHRLFDTALRAGKRVRGETALMAGHASVGSEAARYLIRHLPRDAPRVVAVIGAGKVGSHAARFLAGEPDVEVVLLNRTTARAKALAGEWQGRWGGLDDLGALLPELGGILVATGAPTPWVTADVLEPRCKDRTLPVIDVSMPRNVRPAVRDLPGIWLRDLDQVHPEVADVEAARREAVPLVESILAEELEAFRGWLSNAGAREALRPLRELVVDVCRREVGHVAGGKDDEMAERAARRIAAKLMARPMTVFREDAPVLEREELSRALLRLFGEATEPHPLDSR